jgi:hypothetical protein
MSVPTAKGQSGVAWQYHSRSDSHSKAACWTVLFDLLEECDVFRRHATEAKIGFAINHVMVGKISKTLDLVVCRVPARQRAGKRRTFREVGQEFGIVLDNEASSRFDVLPVLMEEQRNDVSEVLIALEAKACMTEHSKSLPRLFAEILATGFLAKQAVRDCLTVAYAVVNAATTFVTPSSGRANAHTQPHDAQLVVDMLGSAIPTTNEQHFGFDAIGATVIDCRNDGSPVNLVEAPPAPGVRDHHHYQRMIQTLCSRYRERFGTTL